MGFERGQFQVKRFQKFLVLAALSFVSFHSLNSWAADSTPLNLTTAWNYAVEEDTQWRSAQANLAAQRELRPQARAALLPSVSTSASWYQVDSDVEGDSDFSSNDFDGSSQSIGIEVRQPLLNLSALKLYSSSKKTMQIVDYNLALAQQSLALRLSNAYFNLLLAKESLLLAQSELRAIERQLDQTQQRFKVGLVSQTDVLEAQAAYDQTKVAVALAENEQSIWNENLSIIIGQPVNDIQNLKATIPLIHMDASMKAWSETVLSNNINLKIAKLEQATAGLNKDATKASYWPTVDLVASYSDAESSFDQTSTQYGLQASWVPFQGGGLRSRIRESELKYQSAKTDVAGLTQTLSRDARNLYKTIKTDIVRIQAQKQAILSSQSALEATKAGYEVGTRNVVDVLNAQRAVFQAKRDFAEARYTWILHELDAAALDATLSDASLSKIDNWLEGS